MFRLAHISDIHLGPLPVVTRAELFSKRLTGYVNFRRNRTNMGNENVTALLTGYLSGLAADHTAITGDLVNLGLPAEFTNAKKWLQSLGEPADHTVILGNHDAYVRGARALALKSWQDWIRGDDNRPVNGDADFPALRRRGKISLISCNSARASAPFMATGYFRKDQGTRLRDLLSAEGAKGQCRIVLIHHAPFPNATSRYKRLIGLQNFMAAIKDAGAELVLHGHTHLSTLERIPGNRTSVPVLCVPAAYQWFGHEKKPAAAINMIEVSGKSGNWQLNLIRHQLNGTGAFVPENPVKL